MDRRSLLAKGLGLGVGLGAPAARSAAIAPKTLRVALDFAETGFDPVPVSDLSSILVLSHIFEPPLTYDYLARPCQLKPLTAAGLPEVSPDFRHLVFTIRPGIFFADDPVFRGRPRELVAEDYVYSLKRHFDPANKSENLYLFESARLLGLSELRERALKERTPFPYDVQVPGLRALDRYRFEVRLGVTDPRFVHNFATPYVGALAREVVEAHGEETMAHPVGTGPFMLAQWRRRSAMVLVRNPRYREVRFDAEPPAGDAESQAIAARLKGRRLPLVDRVEVNVIEEAQPRWLAFLNGEIDMLELPAEFASTALSHGRLAPWLARRGVRMQQVLGADIAHTYFNFLDPMVGGYTPDKVALRRAIGLAFDNQAAVQHVRGGLAIPAQTMIVPQTFGYDPLLHSEGDHPSPARANALLDLFGYVDRNGDGWRERPDGGPLRLRMADTADSLGRRRNELWKRSMDRIGVRIDFESANFGELIKRSMASQLMMWGYSWAAFTPDGDFFLGLAYGPNAYQSNDARFRLPAYDRLYEQQRALADGPERLALMRQASKTMLAWRPYIPHYHRIQVDVVQPRLSNFVRHPFVRDGWRFLDVS